MFYKQLKGVCNTMVERLNGKIQIKTVARGYRTLKTLEAQYCSFMEDFNLNY